MTSAKSYECREHTYRDKSTLVASSVQPAPNMGLLQRSPVPPSIDLAACTGHIDPYVKVQYELLSGRFYVTSAKSYSWGDFM